MPEYVNLKVGPYPVDIYIYVSSPNARVKAEQLGVYFRRLPSDHLRVLFPIIADYEVCDVISHRLWNRIGCLDAKNLVIEIAVVHENGLESECRSPGPFSECLSWNSLTGIGSRASA
jgi:hypothetical protein